MGKEREGKGRGGRTYPLYVRYHWDYGYWEGGLGHSILVNDTSTRTTKKSWPLAVWGEGGPRVLTFFHLICLNAVWLYVYMSLFFLTSPLEVDLPE
jgi:hypothetical protein